jgi:hypothetical protein
MQQAAGDTLSPIISIAYEHEMQLVYRGGARSERPASRGPYFGACGGDQTAGAAAGLRRRTAAEMRVMTRPTGNGSMKV